MDNLFKKYGFFKMKVYLAAYETQFSNYDVYLPLDSNVFCTYFYKKHTEKTLLALKEKGHKGLITIDSGAHSFFEIMGISVTSQKNDEKKKDLPDPYEYFENYLQWIKKWYNYFSYFVELDLQALVTQDVVDKWRNRMKEEGVFDKCITVQHSYNSWNDFLKLIDESKSKYIAIEGIRKDIEMIDYNKFIKVCYERNIKIHGFALTRAKLLDKCPFYSVDSSSWTAAIRFGKIHIWDSKSAGIKIVDSSKKHFSKYNIPIHLHSNNRSNYESKLKCEFNAMEYQKMENYFTELWKKRGIEWK